MEAKDAWHWMDDGEDHLESLICPILIKADVLRRLIKEGRQAGIKEGIRLYAWWKDGIQYVGTTGRTLKQALEEIDS